MKVLALAAIVACIGYAETRLFDVSSPLPPSHVQAKGIVWGQRTFVDLGQFARWLRSRGVSYRVWARRHPIRSGFASRHPTTAQARRAEEASDDSSNSGRMLGLWGIVAALAAVCLALASRGRVLVRSGAELFDRSRSLVLRSVAFRPSLQPQWPRGGGTVAARVHRSAGLAAGTSRLAGTLSGPIAAGIARLPPVVARYATAVRQRRGELAWFAATALLGVAAGLVVAAWLGAR